MKLKSSHYLIVLGTVAGALAFLSAAMSSRRRGGASSPVTESDPVTEEAGRTTDTAKDEPALWYDA